ncbi:MAG: hypothetical protein ACI927_000461, partial [Oceanospirillaceae bacterium]
MFVYGATGIAVMLCQGSGLIVNVANTLYPRRGQCLKTVILGQHNQL